MVDVREAAVRVLRDRRFVDEAIEKPREALDPRDRALLTQLVFGATRHRLTLDWLVDRNAKFCDDMLRPIFRVALYQVLFLDRIPAYAAVDAAVEHVKREMPGKVKFANALLRSCLRDTAKGLDPILPDDRVQRLAIQYSHPPWLVARWLKRFGKKTESILRADNLVMPVTAHRLGQATPIDIEGDVTQRKDWKELIVQDATAMAVAPFLGAKPGEHIADLCASPGGKACHLADMVGKKGIVVAMDVGKMAPMRDNLQRLGLTSARLVIGDGVRPPLRAGFDAVLVDAPCSNTGVLARRPDARWRIAPEDPEKMAMLQRRLLDVALTLVKKGGRVVYSTCSLESEENEGVVAGRAEKEMLTLPSTAAAGGYMARIRP